MNEKVALSVEVVIFPSRNKIYQVQFRLRILPSTSEAFVGIYPRGISKNYDHANIQDAITRYNGLLKFWDVLGDHKARINSKISTELSTAGVLHAEIPDNLSMYEQTTLTSFFPTKDLRPYKPGHEDMIEEL